MLNNESVIALVKAGIGNDAVIAKIESKPGSYALSSDDLITLKNALPGDVIAAMIAGPPKPDPVAAMSLMDINPMTPQSRRRPPRPSAACH